MAFGDLFMRILQIIKIGFCDIFSIIHFSFTTTCFIKKLCF